MLSIKPPFKATLAALVAVAAIAAHAAGNLDRADSAFVKKAAVGGMYEVAVSKLAAEKATSPEVKAFAEMLVKDHTAANEELKQIASAKSVTLPSEMPRAKRSKIDKLGKMSGAKFDHEYLEEVGLEDHKADIKLFQKESETGKDADVKAFASKTLPTLKEHRAAAQKLYGSTRTDKKA